MLRPGGAVVDQVTIRRKRLLRSCRPVMLVKR